MSTIPYKLHPSQVKELVPPMGYCYASDMVTIDGLPVGFMCREPREDDEDSGWRFYSGLETDEYVEDEHHFMMFDVNYVANLDPAIIPYLKSKKGAEYERVEGTDRFTAVDAPF